MKIIRQLRAEPHPSIIQFEAFIITESFALYVNATPPDPSCTQLTTLTE